MTDLVIRSLAAGEENLFDSLPDPGLVGRARFGERYSVQAAKGEYRPDWSWVALRGDVVVARAAWWAGPGETTPVALDWFDFTDYAAAVQLLRTAPLRAEYSIRLPIGWRDNPEEKAATEARINAATEAGLRFLVERYRYRWTPECGLPERPNRLVYRPISDDAALLALFERIHIGSLDAHARRLIAESGVAAAAQDEVDFLRWLPAKNPQLACLPSGEVVGLTIPAHNHHGPVIGFIAVLPEYRGHGYAYDLLVEATHQLVAEGADRIVAATDVPNIPMAANFAKAGYPIIEHRIDLI